MADFIQYLPFSQRPTGDESHVSKHWDEEIGSILVQVAGLLEELTPEQWESPSLCEGWRIRDVAGHFVWRVGSSTREMLRTASRAYFGHHLNPMPVIDELSRLEAESNPSELVREIRRAAAQKFAGRGRTGITELTECVVHTYDIANPLGVDLAIDDVATGAVAVSRALLAPTRIKAVLNARTLVATDAGWRVGHGPAIEGTAEAIVLFLFGRKPLPGRDRR